MVDFDLKRTLDECVDFTRRLIMTPSMPAQEHDIGRLVMDEMTKLQYDDVWIDEIGNVSGRIRGTDPHLGAIVFNSHLDHVDPGDLSQWQFPPFSAKVHEGRVFGRGACDIKGPLAVQVYGAAAVLLSGVRPKRDIVVSAVVQEETGGAGAVHWVKNLDYPVDLMVLGEPSSNHISLGHRGIWLIWASFEGRSVHASVPERGINPNYAMARFLDRLSVRQFELGSHSLLGDTSVAPTIVKVDTQSSNVIPAQTRVLLDFRTATESVRSLEAFVEDVGGDLEPQIESPWLGLPESDVDLDETISGFYTPPENEFVRRAQDAIGRGMGWMPELTNYRFATDGRHVAAHTDSIAIVGYSPGEENLAHTVKESISIDMMLDSLKGHIQLIREV